MLLDGDRLVVDRPAPRKPNSRMPFDICMVLAKATEVGRSADSEQAFFRQAKLIAAIVQRGKDLKAYSIAYS